MATRCSVATTRARRWISRAASARTSSFSTCACGRRRARLCARCGARIPGVGHADYRDVTPIRAIAVSRWRPTSRRRVGLRGVAARWRRPAAQVATPLRRPNGRPIASGTRGCSIPRRVCTMRAGSRAALARSERPRPPTGRPRLCRAHPGARDGARMDECDHRRCVVRVAEQLGSVLRRTGRTSDAVGRLGRTEFAIIAPPPTEAPSGWPSGCRLRAAEHVRASEAPWAPDAVHAGNDSATALIGAVRETACPRASRVLRGARLRGVPVDAVEMLVRAAAALRQVAGGGASDSGFAKSSSRARGGQAFAGVRGQKVERDDRAAAVRNCCFLKVYLLGAYARHLPRACRPRPLGMGAGRWRSQSSSSYP